MMPIYKGEILRQGKVILRSEKILIEENWHGNVHHWYGSLPVPPSTTGVFMEMPMCELHLEDGRRGRFLSRQFDCETLEFSGSGPLARPKKAVPPD